MTIENREFNPSQLTASRVTVRGNLGGVRRKHGGDGEACGLTAATLVPAVRFVLYGAAVRVGSSSVAVTSGHKGNQSTMLTEGSVSSHGHFAASRVAKLGSSLQISCVDTAQIEVPAGPFSKRAFYSFLHRRSCVKSSAFWTLFSRPRAEEKATGAWNSRQEHGMVLTYMVHGSSGPCSSCHGRVVACVRTARGWPSWSGWRCSR